MNDDRIIHYGVKGMKWGVRKSKAEIARSRSSDARQTDRIRKKAKSTGVGSLSNTQIQTAVRRIQLERQYSQMNPTAMTRGLNAIKGLLSIGEVANKTVKFVDSPIGSTITGSKKNEDN